MLEQIPLGQLRAQSGYLPFLAAATLARVSDEMFSVGVVLLVLERTGDAGLAGLMVAAVALPSLVTGPLLGAWLDLSGRRTQIMVLDQLLISGMLIVLVAVVGVVQSPVVIAIVLVGGLTYPLSFGGFTSLIPQIVPDELLHPANAVETASLNASLVVGPALAGILAAAFGPASSLLVEAGLALAALPLIVRIPALAQTTAERTDCRGLLEVAWAGLRHIAAVPALRGTTAAAAIGMVGLGLLTVAFPLFAVEHLNSAPSDAGFMWAAFAVGSTLGVFGLVRLQRRFAAQRIVVVGYVLLGALMLLWPLADSLAVFLGLVTLAAAVDGPTLAAQFAVRQQFVPALLYGQVSTSAVGLKVGSFAFGAALAGPLTTSLGSDTTLLLAASAQLVASVVGMILIRSHSSEDKLIFLS